MLFCFLHDFDVEGITVMDALPTEESPWVTQTTIIDVEDGFLTVTDNIAAIKPMLDDGRVAATADQHGDQLAVFGIEAALQIIAGEATPEDRKTPVDLITK